MNIFAKIEKEKQKSKKLLLLVDNYFPK